jgi:4a-hydroxytetrahydrobiopterin dehydratase
MAKLTAAQTQRKLRVYRCPVSGVTRALASGKIFAMPRLKAAQIKSALKSVPDWKKTGDTITRTFQFKDFPAAIRFVNAIAKLAEKAWHHPDIDIRWNKVTLVLTTHSEGGLTGKDFKLARQFDRA